jgi:HAD superfamily hydrolase (TIGR01509 family)
MTVPKTGALVFDLGKVLIDFSVERACNQVSTIAGVTPVAIKKFLFDDGLELEFERGNIDFKTLHQKFGERFNVSVSQSVLAHAAADIFTPMEESLSLLKKLRRKYQKTIPFVLLSNTNEIHWNHIESNWRVSELFDHVVLSYQVRSIKPDAEIFMEAIRLTGLTAERCFFVDDVAENIAGARRVGLDCEIFQGAAILADQLARRGFTV